MLSMLNCGILFFGFFCVLFELKWVDKGVLVNIKWLVVFNMGK